MEWKFDFSCEICKESPQVIIFDGNAKVRCSMDFHNSVDKSIPDGFDGVINTETFWESNSFSVLARMFGKSKDFVNLKFAPIIDDSVKAEKVFNTEFLKLNPIVDVQQSGHKEISLDEIRNICAGNFKNLELRQACDSFGIRVQPGLSNEDLRSMLLSHFENSAPSQTFSFEMKKLFPSFSYTNGGFLFGLCEHGIVYYCKFLVRGEGSRDVLDAILSFKNRPKYVIYDDAGRLSEHANKRLGIEESQRIFGPNGGRVAANLEANIAEAKQLLDHSLKYLIDQGPDGITLILYDRFHQNNSNKPSAVLRFMDLVKRLKSVNSQHAERLNGMLRQRTRTLNLTKPGLAFNILKRFLSSYNTERNNEMSKKKYKSVQEGV